MTPTRLEAPSSGGTPCVTARAVLTGALLTLCLAIFAPYGNMAIRGSYLSGDFSTPGAIFLFFIFVGLANSALGLIGRPLALRGGELLVVYCMLLVGSAIPTFGLCEYLLPIIAGVRYYATPENNWQNLFLHFLPDWIAPHDDKAIQWFFEGAPGEASIPWEAWQVPLASWGLMVAALCLLSISSAVILRRQWVERERLAYPILQVPLEMVRQGDPSSRVRPFYKSLPMWAGFCLPVILSSLVALHAYHDFIPAPRTAADLPLFRDTLNLRLWLSFPIIGFSYLINTEVAFSLWFFNLLAFCIKGTFRVLGVGGTEHLGIYGVANEPILAHQGMGAMAVLVLAGLWLSRRHLRDVAASALGSRASVDDSREIMSYRAAVLAWLLGFGAATLWLWWAGLPLWAAAATLAVALLLFVGLTRIVAETGVASIVGPMIASSAIVSAVGTSALGGAGLVSLASTYAWGADHRIFLMGCCAHGLKLSDHMAGNLRLLLWAILLAIVLSLVASVWTVLHLAYEYGGVNLSTWFFNGGARAPFEYIAVKLNAPTGPDSAGWLHKLVGAAAMGLLMLARYGWQWWPLHPIGYPISAVWTMELLWCNIFLAWLIKSVGLHFGGVRFYRATRPFFLGLIMGQYTIAGFWLLVDYFTGMTDNVVFWI